ncbi:methyltransferase domain-containing protein [Allochromatium tepidum]|uniref:SAM-dependent methyltransferase n=1 Tax=Allochromatium tepidum TaxID=553982 RepID=A0ABN6GDJ9_9GAMM|nr:methyltransferase domain-containing protein [Allochromatium tepidum]BCU08003.1 SAM-dependent methyltransferase [Allochromatium tepidum]
MSLIPSNMLSMRRRLSERYLAGRGIEIGALHIPLHVGPAVEVRYVDRLTPDRLRRQYPELNAYDLVDVDIVDDGERLTQIADGEVDFIIANHMLEHCENPLGAMRSHLAKLKPQGVIYYAVPDKRHCFDAERPLTDFEHLVRDDRQGPEVSRRAHFAEWVRYVNKILDPVEAERQLERLLEIDYSIHFHVWDFDSFNAFLNDAQAYLNGAFHLREFQRNDTEIIAILQADRRAPVD